MLALQTQRKALSSQVGSGKRPRLVSPLVRCVLLTGLRPAGDRDAGKGGAVSPQVEVQWFKPRGQSPVCDWHWVRRLLSSQGKARGGVTELP